MKEKKVIVTIDWKVPHPDNHVEWQYWSTSRDRSHRSARNTFKYFWNAFGNHTSFAPHYEVYSADMFGCKDAKDLLPGKSCSKLCLSMDACAFDPEEDTTVGLDGIDVLQENVRQLCLWKNVNSTISSGMAWWDYMETFDTECNTVDATQDIFNAVCSKNVLKKVGERNKELDVKKVEKCIKEEGLELMKEQAELRATLGVVNLPAFMVNDLQHYGGRYMFFQVDMHDEYNA